jgi:2-polyprenyl-6-methoxyphenol hydroxylase-like FAD-dependent oxidoreductase
MAESFCCIIVGGGPIGLIAAHSFSAAGLDWVLLEQEENLVMSNGPAMVMYPDTLRVMDQLGLLTKLSEIKSVVACTHTLTHQGVEYNTSYSYEWSEEKYACWKTLMAIQECRLTLCLVMGEEAGIFINHN